MVVAQSLFLTLQHRYPGCRIDVVAPPVPLPLLTRMPEVSEIIDLGIGHGKLGLGRRYRVARSLRGHAYDQAIVFSGTIKAALLPAFACIPRRTGLRGEWRPGLINDLRDRRELGVESIVSLGLEPGEELPSRFFYPALTTDPQNQRELIERFGLRPDRSAVIVVPGAGYGPAKRWPLERFAELAAALVGQNRDVWVLGSKREFPLGEELTALVESARNLCGTSLLDAVDLAALATSVVSNDSGLMHLSAATGSNVVGIYGPSTPDVMWPLSDSARVLYRGIECSPCWARTCPYGHMRCMTEISVPHVLEALQSLESEAPPSQKGESRLTVT